MQEGERRGRLLIVDDEEPIAEALADVLGSAGYQVTRARDGRDALQKLRNARPLPDAILLDLRMPNMDGWSFRAEQRRDPALASIPAIVISADLSPQAEAIDAAAFIPKPLDTATLLRELGRILAEVRARAQRDREAHRERLQSLGRLAAGVAHEINNPLAWVNANLRLLEERLAELGAAARPALERTRPDADAWLAETTELVRDSLEGARRIRDIVQQVRSFSQPQASQPSTVALLPIVEAAIKMSELQARHRARVERQLEPTPPVIADPTQLAQLFVNLLLNAADAIGDRSGRGGRIDVRTRTDEKGRAVVEIADDGPGIPESVRARLFEPFFTTKPAGRGTGLGLFVCHNIVSALGGELSLESPPSGGTVARVVLRPGAAAQRPAQEAASAAVVHTRRKLLVIEDERILARALQRLLAGRYDVEVALSVNEALARLGEGAAFDAILCDVHMPERGGPELYEEVKQRWPALCGRLLFMSGGAVNEASQRFIEQQGEKVLSKPLDLERLDALVRTL